jgi:hypothetical protein
MNDLEMAAPSESPRNAQRIEKDGAGCLVGLGAVGLVPVLAILWSLVSMNLEAAWSSLDWTSISALCQSAWQWVQRGGGHISITISWLFLTGYCLLFWQWLAFRIGWRTLISSPRLWTVSSVFFGGLIVFVAYVMSKATGSFAEWLKGTIAACTIPGVLLAMALRLRLLNNPKE